MQILFILKQITKRNLKEKQKISTLFLYKSLIFLFIYLGGKEMENNFESKKNIIWSNDITEPLYESFVEEMIENALDESREDEIANLNIPLSSNLICYGEIGRWNGTVRGYKILRPNINAIFDVSDDYNSYYVEDGELKASGCHHDGINTYHFRKLSNEYFVADFEDAFFDAGTPEDAYEVFISMTENVGNEVKKIYGWK